MSAEVDRKPNYVLSPVKPSMKGWAWETGNWRMYACLKVFKLRTTITTNKQNPTKKTYTKQSISVDKIPPVR